MNAFPRSDAIETLDSYAFTIVLHITLLTFFPDHGAKKHWLSELNAFKKTLLKVSKGKKGRNNLYSHLVLSYLNDHLVFREDEEKFELYIEAKGLALPESPDWAKVKAEIVKFTEYFPQGD